MNINEYISKIDRDDILIHIPHNLTDENAYIDNVVLLISHELSRTGSPIQLLFMTKALQMLGYHPFIFSLSGGDLINDFMDLDVPVICGVDPDITSEWIDKLTDGFRLIFINTITMAGYVRYLINKPNYVFWWIHESAYWFNYDYINDIPVSPNLKILAASEKIVDHIKAYTEKDPVLLNVCVEDKYISGRNQSEKTVFLWSGTLEKNKAPEILLEAILLLPNEYTDKVEFILVGHNRANDKYSDLVKTISDKLPFVWFMDAMNHSDFLNLMDEVDSVIVTSIEETTSMVAVEGFMKGKIVICSDGCGVTRYIEDKMNGFVFKTRDSKMLSEIIKYVVDNISNLDNLKHSGRIMYEKYYLFDGFKSNLENLLNEMDLKR